MPPEADLLAAIERDPADDLAWLALADALEESGEAERAELVRLRQWLRSASLEHAERDARESRLGDLLRAGVRPAVPTWKLELGEGVTLPLVLIPAGAFWMGSPDEEEGHWNEEGPRHRVIL